LPIFGEKIDVFLKNQCYDPILTKSRSSLGKKRQYFRPIFRRKYFKNRNIGPRFTISMLKSEKVTDSAKKLRNVSDIKRAKKLPKS
jgi:hypothetical protein